MKRKTPVTEQRKHDAIAAEQRAGYWLAEMNEADEKGNKARAAMCEVREN